MDNWQDKAQDMFGYHWQQCLADLCEVHKRSVQRWVSGDFQLPDELKDKINATYEIWRSNNEDS